MRLLVSHLVLLLAAIAAAGCDSSAKPTARTPLDRPLVVLGGYRCPEVFVEMFEGNIRRRAEYPVDQSLAVGSLTADSFDEAVVAVISAVESRWPSSDPHQTVEVDVVGISMGGVVARAAARQTQPSGKRLNARRIFTLGSPHKGAVLADSVVPDALARDMRAGSEFLQALDADLAHASYDLVCYAKTHDGIVGATRAFPEGHACFWIDGPLLFSHFSLFDDDEILSDLSARLRNRTPLLADRGPPPRD